MKRSWKTLLSSMCVCLIAACAPAETPQPDTPQVAGGADDIERGRYIVTLGGCNDCHTERFMELEGDVPEEDWLKGSVVGWMGPWGTTYPRNLRLTVQNYTEDQFVELLRTRTALPPMPWMNINQMAEADARAVYRYIGSLGPAGEDVPMPLPPGEVPTTPYLNLAPVMPEGG